MARRMRVLYEKILVRQDDERETVAGSDKIAAADAYKEKPFLGTVVAVGEGRLMDNGTIVPLRVKVDDRVLFTRHSGRAVPEDLGYGKNLVVMREDEVGGIDEGEA